MTLMFGHTSYIDLEYESVYNTTPTGDWKRLPVASFDPGVSQPWEKLDIVGLAGGRNEPVPQQGLLTVEPKVEVPMDLNNLGYWLKLLFGAPTTAGSTNKTHTFVAGGTTLPSASIQHANAGLSANPFMLLCGLRAGSLEMPFRFGEVQQTASIGLVGASASRGGTTNSGTPTEKTFTPFTGAVGTVKRAGSALARVTGATLRYSNGLEMLREANRASAAITEAAPGPNEITGTVDLRMDDDTLLADSEGTAPVALEFGYSFGGTQYLTATVHAAYLNRIMPAVRGRAGIQATFAFRGAFASGAGKALTLVLANQQASYA